MAASGFTPISLYYSTTASAVPTSGNLANGELGLNIADMKLYAKNSAGTVTLLASNAGASGSVTSVSGTGTVNGLTLTGTVTTSGSLTLGGTLSLVSPPAIGSTTPNTGAFTTLSASNGVNSTSLSAGFQLNGTVVLDYSGGNTRLRDLGGGINIVASAATNILGVVGASTITTTSSTGLAVTGTLSSSGAISTTSTSGANITINPTNVAFGTTGTLTINGQQTNQAGNPEISRIVFGSGSSSGSTGSKIATIKGNDNYTDSLAFFTSSGGGAVTERVRILPSGGFSVGTTADPGTGAIYATGNITAYYSSDIKFKENVRDIPDALATVNAIGGKLFDWKDDYIESKGGADGYFVQKADFGVVAQDVQKVFPIAVRTRDDGSLAVDYEKLGALAFAALVELTKRVEALEAK
jgi:hypothetical protein